MIRRFLAWLRRRRVNRMLDRRRVDGCVERHCKGEQSQHGACLVCGAFTCFTAIIPNPKNGKRQFQPLCWPCDLSGAAEPLRKRRTLHDWTMTTANGGVRMSANVGDQYESFARSAIRAFLESDLDIAVIADATPGGLQDSIRSLGLQDVVYEEQRGGEVVLRRAVPRWSKTDVPLLPIKGQDGR